MVSKIYVVVKGRYGEDYYERIHGVFTSEELAVNAAKALSARGPVYDFVEVNAYDANKDCEIPELVWIWKKKEEA